VTNPVGLAGGSDAGPGTGYGLLGTAERVGSVRGTLRHGLDGLGSWVLVAELPTAPRGTGPGVADLDTVTDTDTEETA
jgi:hypothetical protein